MADDTKDEATTATQDEAPPITEEELSELDESEFTPDEWAQLKGEEPEKPGPEAELVAEDEKAAESEPETPEQQDPPKTVPIQALHESRNEIKSLKERIGEFEKWQNALAQRLIQARTEKEQSENQPEEPPDENADPIATIAYLKQQLADFQGRYDQSERERQERGEAAEREAQESQATIDRADTALSAAMEADPQVADAFQFASKAVAEELQRLGYRGPALQQKFNEALLSYARTAPNDPEAMREYAYRNARYWGWAPGQGQQKPDSQSPNGAQQIDKLKKAVDASKTLSGGGAGPGGEVTLEDLESMSGAELERFASENPELFEKLSGIK